MIEYDTLLSIPFLKKSRFTGSYRGMRYVVFMKEEEEQKFLAAKAYPGPFSADCTKEELFTENQFSFDDEGRKAAVDWLNELYNERKEEFEDVLLHPCRYYKSNHI